MANVQILVSARDQSGGVLDKIGAQADKLKSKFASIGESLTRAGGIATAGLTAPLTALGATAVRTAASFEQAMANVAAISGATGAEFDALVASAEELGRTTSFSASEAADGMKFLAQAGFETQEIMAAMPGLLSAAAAGATDLGTTADIVSNVMSGFGLQASQAGQAADVMTAAFTSSNTDLVQLGEAMKFVAPVAASLGISMEETAASIGILSDAGIQASMAGTTLRSIMTRLAAPTGEAAATLDELGIKLQDMQGNFVGLPSVIGQFEAALSGMSSTQQAAAIKTVVGQEAMSGFLALLDRGAGDLSEFTSALENSGGTAERIAQSQLGTLEGQMKLLQSATEGLQISIGNALLPTLTQLAQQAAPIISNMAEAFASLSPQMQQFSVVGAGVAAALGPLLLALGAMAPALAAIVSPVGLVVAGLGALFALDAGGIRTMTADVLAFAGSIAGNLSNALPFASDALSELSSQFIQWDNNFDTLEGFQSFIAALTGSEEIAISVADTVGNMAIKFLEFKESFTPLTEDLAGLGAAFGELGSVIASTFPGGGNEQVGFAAAALGLATLEAAMQTVGNAAQFLGAQLRTVTQSMTELVSGLATATSGLLEGDFAKVAEGVTQMFAGLEIFMTGSIGNLTNLLEGFGSTLATFAKDSAKALGFEEISKQIDAIQTKVAEAWLQIKDSVEIIIESFSWSDFVRKFEWPTLPRFSWSNFVGKFKWPSLPSFSWGSFIKGVDLKNLIPSFPGWSSLFDGFNPFGGGGATAPAQNATGSLSFPGGLTWVGERGPELIAPPRGSRIFNNDDSMALAGAGGITVNVNVASVSSDMDLNSMAHQIADIINRRRR